LPNLLNRIDNFNLNLFFGQVASLVANEASSMTTTRGVVFTEQRVLTSAGRAAAKAITRVGKRRVL